MEAPAHFAVPGDPGPEALIATRAPIGPDSVSTPATRPSETSRPVAGSAAADLGPVAEGRKPRLASTRPTASSPFVESNRAHGPSAESPGRL